VEPRGNRAVDAVVLHLALAAHVHELDAREDDARAPETLETALSN
jgi:hypothetical protein